VGKRRAGAAEAFELMAQIGCHQATPSWLTETSGGEVTSETSRILAEIAQRGDKSGAIAKCPLPADPTYRPARGIFRARERGEQRRIELVFRATDP